MVKHLATTQFVLQYTQPMNNCKIIKTFNNPLKPTHIFTVYCWFGCPPWPDPLWRLYRHCYPPPCPRDCFCSRCWSRCWFSQSWTKIPLTLICSSKTSFPCVLLIGVWFSIWTSNVASSVICPSPSAYAPFPCPSLAPDPVPVPALSLPSPDSNAS